MSTKITKKKKKQKKGKVARLKKEKREPQIPDTYYRVDMECSDVDKATGHKKYWFIEYYPGRDGTMDEQMARSIAESLKKIGQGGRLIELDGTPEGKVLETWGGVGRLEQAEKEIKNLSPLT